MSKLTSILKTASKMEDRSLARKIRVAAIESFGVVKTAQTASGVLSYDNSRATVDYPTREEVLRMRGGKPEDRSELYPTKKEEKVDVELPYVQPSLSTRYVPGKPGLQAARVLDTEGAYQDPYTKKVFNWYEGFKAENGEEFAPGSVANQSQLHY